MSQNELHHKGSVPITAADERFMRLAIDKARHGIEAGQSPFGACIVRGDEVVSCEHNIVLASTDSTAHAEVTAIRVACRKLATIDLSACTIYSTCEPCPMCFSACHWARLARIVFGVRSADAQRIGFRELPIAVATMKDLGGSPAELVADCLRVENLAVMQQWLQRLGDTAY
jgi:guanine deaminase